VWHLFLVLFKKLGYDGTLRMSNMTGSIAIIIACSPTDRPTWLGFCSGDVRRTKRIGLIRWTDWVELSFLSFFCSLAGCSIAPASASF
jgi:hypothetical protein